MLDIPGFGGKYKVDRFGNVYGTRGRMQPFTDRDGYKQLTMRKGGKAVRRFVHRLVAQTYIREPLGRETVDHINGDTSDNRLVNLRWLSRSENSRLGQFRVVLTDAQAADIRRRAVAGESYTALAKEYRRGIPTIFRIATGQRYRHLPGPFSGTRHHVSG